MQRPPVLAGVCSEEGTGSAGLPFSRGDEWQLLTPASAEGEGRCCQLAIVRAGRAHTAACRAPSTHSSGSSQCFKSLAFLTQESANNVNKYNLSNGGVLQNFCPIYKSNLWASKAHGATLKAAGNFVVLHLLQQ